MVPTKDIAHGAAHPGCGKLHHERHLWWETSVGTPQPLVQPCRRWSVHTWRPHSLSIWTPGCTLTLDSDPQAQLRVLTEVPCYQMAGVPGGCPHNTKLLCAGPASTCRHQVLIPGLTLFMHMLTMFHAHIDHILSSMQSQALDPLSAGECQA